MGEFAFRRVHRMSLLKPTQPRMLPMKLSYSLLFLVFPPVGKKSIVVMGFRTFYSKIWHLDILSILS